MVERVLVLGGSEFVGRAVVEAALARGSDVTVVNRGRQPAPAGARSLVADRRVPDALARALGDELASRALGDELAAPASEGCRYDLVVDTWSWEPEVVRESARLLEPVAERYCYVSSRSVYAEPGAGADETAALVPVPEEDDGDYAGRKAGGERAVQEAFSARGLLVRPGLILGPWENVGRLPWWLTRMARGGEVLAPGAAGAGIQYVDARDLAWWLLGLPAAVPVAETGAAVPVAGAAAAVPVAGAAVTAAGVAGPTAARVIDPGVAGAGRSLAVDAVSPVGRHTMGELLEACAAVAGTGPAVQLTWAPEDVLLAEGVEPWIELPVWLPAGPDHDALHGSDVSRALATGLAFRPLAETVADTWAWLGERGGVPPQRADRPSLGLSPEKERRVLERLRQ
ncbi:NAD-dependent epimerase/dehydratase family protein [Herbiconiux sp. VKM Ac-2851]|uniref:NAD-dependent epimerase/dehydratase family protein n=1 Tax=Herbiconiux sp. VKM Ac-2851 TaxID=2739025 RepID=UPI00156638AA|nr:NAD-dependent epimerase/dehydratase family protein [Herbiconiux sp. VKM Ac-2851]NQX34094.1 NAD-dependent epimerase/dehydratase family protein [Herbiconiux sp. VKM Ac-2851]